MEQPLYFGLTAAWTDCAWPQYSQINLGRSKAELSPLSLEKLD